MATYVFELVQPGVWLEGYEDDAESRSDIESLIRLLVQCVGDAAIALNMFEAESNLGRDSSERRMAEWEADRERERAIRESLESQLPGDLPFEQRFAAMDAIRESASVEAKRQKWREGQLPEEYQHRLPFIHAKSCVYALDTLVKAMRLLAGIPSVPSTVSDALDDFNEAFPDLVHVRDSSHHAEDRVQGKRRDVRIELGPVTNDAIHAPGGGVLISDMLINNRYGGTLGDGSYGEVEISADSVVVAQACVQRILSAFEWRGSEMHMPR